MNHHLKLKKQILIVPAIKQGIESQDGFEIFQGNWPSISSVCCPLISLDFDELGTGNVVVEAELRTDSSDCFKDSRIALCVHLCVIPGIIHQSEVLAPSGQGQRKDLVTGVHLSCRSRNESGVPKYNWEALSALP